MAFGTPVSKSYDTASEDIKDLKNHVKLVELDMEKRLVILENSISALQKSIGGIQQFDASRDALIQIQEIKNSLREIEDTNLISKLDTIGNSDKIAIITENVTSLNGKIKLISDAIDIIGESKSKESGEPKESGTEISGFKSELDALKNAVSRISASLMDPQKIAELSEQINSLEHANAAINSDIKKTYEIYHEKIGLLERQISTLSEPQAPAKDNSPAISEIKEEIERLKAVNKRLIEMIELDSRTLHELNGIRSEGETYKKINASIDGLAKKVSDMGREMGLDRAMYPENFMKLEKEVGGIKSTISDFANLVKSIDSRLENGIKKAAEADALKKQISGIDAALSAKINSLEASMKKIGGNANAGGIQDAQIKNQKNIKEIENSITDISIKVAESASLKGRIAALENDLRSIKNVMQTGSQKPGMQSSKGRESLSSNAPDVSDRLAAIEREIGLDRAMYPENFMKLEKEVAELVQSQKNISDSIKSLPKLKKIGLESIPDIKKILLVEKNVRELSEKIAGIPEMKKEFEHISEELNALKNEVNSAEENMQKIVLDYSPASGKPIQEEKLCKSEDSPAIESILKMVHSLAMENKGMRKELEQLKQVCDDIAKENQQQPIIID